ncbi:Uncharacterised protein [Sphingobacterium mizutaii]|uniref:Uncharacterized protein n=1 Tax=Sphingobacterium mizutaii TaxID=1010 RepID=A0AAJ4XA58_9SPHI|nr:hypothetical protein SAMN05192578_101196 [Sphingobacterium mizutaii]SNV46958.1 Uncharacterised protein [Sphingobacterium mizutaii]
MAFFEPGFKGFEDGPRSCLTFRWMLIFFCHVEERNISELSKLPKLITSFILLTFSFLYFGYDYDWRTVPVPSVQNDRILGEKNLTDSSPFSESLFSAFPILNGK